MSRREDILFDRNLLIAERKRLLEAMAVMQRRVDKIEERFDEAGLTEEGQER